MFYRGARRGIGRVESRGGLGSGGGRQSLGNNDDDNEEEAEGEGEGEGESWFAGGERRQVFFRSFFISHFLDARGCSGISVENPDSRRSIPGGPMVRDLLRRAAQYVF